MRSAFPPYCASERSSFPELCSCLTNRKGSFSGIRAQMGPNHTIRENGRIFPTASPVAPWQETGWKTRSVTDNRV
jgi:hypothetical protein